MENQILKKMNILKADGVDFHPIFTRPPDCEIIQSCTKEELENPNILIPRSDYTFWKMVDGVKYYILPYKKMMPNYKFGDKIIYVSPQDSELGTPCIFIRDDNGKAVVLFENAEWVARVNYRNIKK